MERLSGPIAVELILIASAVEVMDVKIPENLQRAMAAEAEAARNARAQVIGAEGELKASQALKDASSVVSSNPAALQVRTIET